MLELLEILFENHFCEKVYLNKDHNQSITVAGTCHCVYKYQNTL